MRSARLTVCAASLLISASACRRSRLPPKPDGAAVVVVEPDAGTPGAPALAYAPEIEPNDTAATAQAVVLDADHASVGVASRPVASKDVDVYRVSVPAGARRRLSVDVYPVALTTFVVDALDAKDSTVTASTGSAVERDGLPNLAVDGGASVVVRVKATGTGSYRVVFGLGLLRAGDESEPNGKPALANQAALSDEKTGLLGWPRDEDWFAVPLDRLPEGGVLWAELDGPAGVAAAVAIHDAAGRKLGERTARKTGRVSLRDVVMRPDDPQAFVVVRAISGRSLDAPYVLRIGSDLAKLAPPDAGPRE